MELRETIESINERLINEFGIEFDCGNQPRFRVVFSDDIYEKRLTSFTDDGIELIHPEVRLLPKYKQWVRGKFILERLIPIIGETDLVSKVSYEPCWVFQDKHGNYLPPFFDGCKHIIEALYQAAGQAGCYTKYKDKTVTKEERLAEIMRVENELFGNESDVTDHLAYGTGVVVPGNDTLH